MGSKGRVIGLLVWAMMLPGVTLCMASPACRGRDAMTDQNGPLSEQEERVIRGKGTERPFSGRYWNHHEAGTYACRLCGAPLFESGAKFDSGTGWPSFDTALPGAVRRIADADGMRTEIVCARCGGHLGHVFVGEGFTASGERHCVNSASLQFAPAALTTRTAYFAGGCFWGVEHLMSQVEGINDVASGYMGGRIEAPTYEAVCGGRTGHVEAVRVTYDPARVSYEALARRFFEIHDPTQADGQGPDIGEQYRSVVFVSNPEERAVIEGLIGRLQARGYRVATRIEAAGTFWPAEDYHQDYYRRKGQEPYCHRPVPRFEEGPSKRP